METARDRSSRPVTSGERSHTRADRANNLLAVKGPILSAFHTVLFCVVLLLPGTSLTEWQTQGGPNLRAAMRAGALGLVNVRTAERDAITPLASCLSIGTAARVKAAPHELPGTRGLGYAALGGNLGKSLSDGGVNVAAADPLERAVCYGAHTSGSAHGELIVENLGPDPITADREIGVYRKVVERDRGLLIVLSPNPSKPAFARFDRLTPILLLSPRRFKPGLATSASTRTKGLITNTDIAPTIAAFFGVPLEGPVYGVPAGWVASRGDTVAKLNLQNEQWIADEHRLSFRPYIALALAMLIVLGTTAALVRGDARSYWSALICLVPAAMLSAITFAVSIVLLSLAATNRYPRRTRQAASASVAGVTALWITLDGLFHGGAGAAHSFLGYSPIEGARYYGIGNEAMGVWLGAAALTAGWLAGRVRGGWLLAGGAVIAISLGHPLIGAKAGGFLAALLTILGFWWALSGRAFKLLVAAFAIVAVIAAGTGLEAFMGRFGASHVTQSLAMARHGGAGALVDAVVRKAAMNVHLLTHSTWTLLLIACLYGAWRLIEGIAVAGPRSRAMVYGTLSATAASLALNDAGVVAAALSSLYLWTAAATIRAENAADVQP
ncbi:MAG: hypothetical protein P4L33_09360 [Capsulimonadaceae bacterium]|nr:hypothetical protein [Capsulimonadaceae bacterium]